MGICGCAFDKLTPRFLGLLSLAALISCSSVPVEMGQGGVETTLAPSTESLSVTEAENAQSLPISPEGVQRRPQLVKHAFLRIELADIEGVIEAVTDILTQYQGDLLQLSDQEKQSNAPRQVLIELRVPQNNLELVLNDFRTLGTVQEQSITAEDVSTQLVDLQARVRNLRKSEEALLEIMERSGSISDVLEVTQQLNTVRESVERTDAQLKNLQNQVAYSTISLDLLSRQLPSPPTSPIGESMSLTWQSATSSMRLLSVGLLKLVLWLLAFSPYVGVLVLLGWVGRRYWQSHRIS